MRWLAALLPLCAADVALVDIRGTRTGFGTAAILKTLLATTYVTGGIMTSNGEAISTDGMTLNEAISGSFIVEVTTPDATADELDNFWCLHSAQKGLFSSMVELQAGLDVTEIVTCIGEPGEGCTASTTCSGDSGTTPEPEPEDDNGGLSTLAIVLIVVGVIIALGVALYLAWPSIAPLLNSRSSDMTAGLVSTKGTTAARLGGTELPPLFAPL